MNRTQRFKFAAGAAMALLIAACTPTTTTTTAPAAPKAPVVAEEVRQPVTLLVSIDGFKPDYLRRGITPTLNKLAKEGAYASMRPSFPSKTFPNHYTIVTGKRPNTHGIVDNNMRDIARPAPNENFSLGNSRQSLDPFWWSSAEPLWVTAERRGIRSATMFWPGSEVAIHGGRAQDWQRFDQNISNTQRVNAVIDWLRRPTNLRPKFLTVYFDTVDMAGHHHGPDSAELNASVADIDKQLGYLVSSLAAMKQPVDIVITSDHGMAATSSQRLINLDTLLPRDSYQIISSGAFASLNPLPGKEAIVDAALITPLVPHANMECWHKKDIPARYHYGSHPRVPEIFCQARTGWTILAGTPEFDPNGGNHGYDNFAPEMAALFIANGPHIAAGKILPTFDNVDVYPLLAYLIGLEPLPYDGVPHLPSEVRNVNAPPPPAPISDPAPPPAQVQPVQTQVAPPTPTPTVTPPNNSGQAPSTPSTGSNPQ